MTPATKSSLIIAAALIAAMVWQSGSDSHSPSNATSSASTGIPAQSIYTDDADRLIARCGKPSLDDSTAYDTPRPSIPSRFIEYDQQNLRFMFVPGDDTKLGDPPPYHWKFIRITEMTARYSSPVRVVTPSEALERMPCWR